MRKLLPGYSKGKYRAKGLIEKVEAAMKNETQFCEDTDGLKEGLGTNIGLLIHKMQKDRKKVLPGSQIV